MQAARLRPVPKRMAKRIIVVSVTGLCVSRTASIGRRLASRVRWTRAVGRGISVDRERDRIELVGVVARAREIARSRRSVRAQRARAWLRRFSEACRGGRQQGYGPEGRSEPLRAASPAAARKAPGGCWSGTNGRSSCRSKTTHYRFRRRAMRGGRALQRQPDPLHRLGRSRRHGDDRAPELRAREQRSSHGCAPP